MRMAVGFTADSFGSGDSGASAPAAPAAAPSAPSVPASEAIVSPTDGSEVDSRASLADAARAAQKTELQQQPAAEPEAAAADPLEAPDPWEEKVLGERSAKAIIEALKKGEGLLPEDLLDLEHEYVFGEGEGAERERMTLREALDLGHKERMQMREFHRRTHDVHQFEQQVIGRARAIEAAIQGLNNPATLFEDLQGLNVSEDTLKAAARHYAQQQLDYARMSPSQRAQVDAARTQRQQLLTMQRELNELRAQKTHGEEQGFREKSASTIRAHMSPAFKAVGLNVESEYARNKFKFFLTKAADGKIPTRQNVFDAAKAAKQDIAIEEREERMTAARAAGQRTPAGKPLGPRSGAAPAALKVPAQANGRARGMTAEEFGR
jgi:hypothetical protein